jgi:spore maturation protein CgeB
MKSVLLWAPGASVSTKDVYVGLRHGLEQAGVNVRIYDAEIEIELASIGLMHLWKSQGSPKNFVPSEGDKIYRAGKGVVAEAIRARIEHGVEWVIVVSGMYQHPDYFVMLRECGFKVALLCTESPYNLEMELRAASRVDAVFTNERSCVEAFRTACPFVGYVPHAWHPVVHTTMAMGEALEHDAPAHDVVFVGTYFQERIDFLGSIDWSGIDLGLYGGVDEIDLRTKAGRALRPFIRGEYVHNNRTAALYRKAKVGLNLHRKTKWFGHDQQIAHAESLNPRCYELAATGCFFVTDYRAELADVFGDAATSFTDAATCEQAIRAALAGDSLRRRKADACRDAVRSHTWVARAAKMVGWFDQMDAIRQQKASAA